MTTLPFTLRQLDVFESVSRCQSFSKCADELGISQASVSNQIKSLERQLGVALLVRNPGKPPSLTLDGQAFLDDLQKFRSACNALAAHRRAKLSVVMPKRFRILVGQPFYERFLRPHLDKFLAEHPMIELQFDPVPPTKRIKSEIRLGRYDFAILHVKDYQPGDEHFREVVTVRTGILAHRKFFEVRDLPCLPDYISNLPFILYPPGSHVGREANLALKKYNIIPNNVCGVTYHMDVMIKMVEQGIGVAALPESLIVNNNNDVDFIFPMDIWTMILYKKNIRYDIESNYVERFIYKYSNI